MDRFLEGRLGDSKSLFGITILILPFLEKNLLI
jgi:hypothetical protein